MAGDKDVQDDERFEELGQAPVSPEPTGVRLWGWLSGLMAAAGVGALARGLGAVAVGLFVGAAAAGAMAWARARRRQAEQSVPRRGLVLRGRGLWFDDAKGGELREVAQLEEPFGVTVVANRARSQAALAVTSAQSTFYVGGVLRESELPGCRALLREAFTVASDERALEPAGPDGMPLVLGGEALARLLAGFERLDPDCLGRFFLTDVRGERVVLEPRRLTIGARTVDLEAGLDWQALLFQEAGHNGMTIYQGTQVRQGGTEVVFVSLMPALSSPAAAGDLAPRDASFEAASQRDLMLLRDVSSEPPPPTSQRVAIDRLFMLPLRAALYTRSGPSLRETARRATRPQA